MCSISHFRKQSTLCGLFARLMMLTKNNNLNNSLIRVATGIFDIIQKE